MELCHKAELAELNPVCSEAVDESIGAGRVENEKDGVDDDRGEMKLMNGEREVEGTGKKSRAQKRRVCLMILLLSV